MIPSPFLRSDEELYRMPEDDLVEHLLRVRRLGRRDEETTAAQVLLYRYLPDMRRRLAGRLPDFPDHVIEELADRAFLSAVVSAARAPWKGADVRSFKAWRNRIFN